MGTPRSLLLVPLAVVLAVTAACGDREASLATDVPGGARSTTSAATVDAASWTRLPADFPLAHGMAGEEDLAGLVSPRGPGQRDLTYCDQHPLRDLEPLDRQVADNSGGEAYDNRELVLLTDAAGTGRAAILVADLARRCPTRTGRGTAVTTTEVVSSPLAPAPAVTLVETHEVDGEALPGMVVRHLVTVGNALLVTGTYGEWADPADGVAETADRLVPVVEAMSVFAGDPPTEPSEVGPEESMTVPPLPEDLDLTTGLPADGGDFDVTPQAPDGEGAGTLTMCGRVVWPIGAEGDVRRLAVAASGPEWFEGRELLVHADAATAVGVLEPARYAVEHCRRFDHQVWTPLEEDTGRESITMGLTYTDGLGSSVLQLTRVGAAVLLVTTSGEGTVDSLPRQAAGVTATTRRLVAQLDDLP